MILPFALFCAVLFVYHRLTVESELTVFKAVGLSNLQIAAPCLLLAVVVTLVDYSISLYFMPLAFRNFRDLQDRIEHDFPYLLLQPAVFNSPADGMTVYVREHRADGTLAGVVVHDERNKKVPVTMMAEQGSLLQGADGPLFVLERGSRQELDTKSPDNPSLSILHFGRYTLDLAANATPPGDRSRKPKEQYVQELLDSAGILEQGAAHGTNCRRTQTVDLAVERARVRDDRDGGAAPAQLRPAGPVAGLLIATIGVVLAQAVSMAVGGLVETNLALIPLLYAVTIAPAVASLLVIIGRWPCRRPNVRATKPA